MHNGIQLPPVQPVMNIASPLNDTQMVSLMAVHLPGDAQDRVELALEIMQETMRQINSPHFMEGCQAIMEEVKRQHREHQRKKEEE